MSRGRVTKKTKVNRSKRIHKNYKNSKKSLNKAPVRVAKRNFTGKKLSVHHTSYALLFFILAFLGLLLLLLNNKFIQAANEVNLSATVLGDPPSTPAQINTPPPGSEFDDKTITLTGSCQSSLIVEIYRNGTFAGSTICSGSGTFTINITLVNGKNTLLAKIKDLSDQYGPDSIQVVVYYNAPSNSGGDSGSSSTGTDTAGSGSQSITKSSANAIEFLLSTKPLFRSAKQGSSFNFWYRIKGGTKPYAIVIDWGDGSKNTVQSVKKPGKHTVSHTYEKSGPFIVEVIGTDIANSRAWVTTVVNVDKTKSETPIGITTKTCDNRGGDNNLWCDLANSIDTAWPAFMFAVALTAGFWLGEKVVLAKVKKDLRNV